MIIDIKQLDPDLPLPSYAKTGDAAVDLYAREDHFLRAGERFLMPTGIAIGLPEPYYGLVLPRSGLAAKQGITIVNAPGLIDSGYRGEIKVILLNTDDNGHHINRGDRIAQLLIDSMFHVEWNVVEELDETERNEGGLGHTGQ